jgi:fructokinase
MLEPLRPSYTVREAQNVVGEATVGIATPGAISVRTGLLKNSNSTSLNGKPIDRDLSAALDQPIKIENDANCLAISEAVDGAGADARVVFGIILGTGVGGSLVINRQVWTGLNRIAGEWGHNPLPWVSENEYISAHACYCGKRGCIETWLSGSGLVREFVSRGGPRSTAGDIANAAESGDQRAHQSLAAYKGRLARALAGVVNIVDPDIVVLGGGLSNIAGLYDDLVERIGAYTFSDGISTKVVRAMHGDSSGVRGAAWLWPLRASQTRRPEE